jgi:soluble lytic murein transglycosylase-like protein
MRIFYAIPFAIFLLLSAIDVFACTRPVHEPSAEIHWRGLTIEQREVARWVHSNSNPCQSTKQVANIVRLTYRYAQQYDIDPHLAFGIMKIESSFNTNAKSAANARGLTQVIPYWHKEKIDQRNIHNPEVGIQVGLEVYREYLNKSKGNHYRAMQKYSGGGGRTYYNKAVAAKKSLQRSLYSALFADGPTTRPVLYASN